MKKIFLLLLVGLGPLCAFAQPSVTTDVIPVAGDSIHLVRCEPTEAQDALTGADQTWDFSGLVPHNTSPDYYFNFYDPGDTPHGDRYPSAFLAATAPDGQWIYYVLDGNTLELTGLVAEVAGAGTAFGDYENHETETVFPLELGATWSDEFHGDNVIAGFGAPFNGTVSGEVDGYGTLILPNGTYQNVVRNRQERTYQVAGAPAVESSTLWVYSAPSVDLWLLSIEEFENGGEQLVYYAESSLIINSADELPVKGQISVHPNPIRAGQILTLTPGANSITEVQLTDFAGRQIASQRAAAVNLFEVPHVLAPGTYFLWMKNERGRFFEKIIITD